MKERTSSAFPMSDEIDKISLKNTPFALRESMFGVKRLPAPNEAV